MKKILYLFVLVILVANAQAQHIGFGAKGGLTVGTQKQKRALISYHGDLFFESFGVWQGDGVERRIGFLVLAGYHRRGASYNSGTFGTNNNYVANDLFHNVSLTAALKGSFKTGMVYPFYAAGLRLDGTLASSVINPIDAQGVQPVMLGLYLGGGIEWEPQKSPFGIVLDLSICPDLTPQIFFRKGTQILYYPYGSQVSQTRSFTENYKVINVSIEISAGFKFLVRKEAEPEEH